MDGVKRANKFISWAKREKSLCPLTVKQAVRRHLADLDRKDVYFDPVAANSAIANVELFVHVKGELQGRPIVLEPWQCFVVASIFGWKWTDTRLRRYRYAYLQIPRKNGKTLLAICIALVFFALDGELGAEVYLGATGQEHANELLFYPAKRIAEQTPGFIDECQVTPLASRLVIPDTFSRLFSVIRKPDDGYSPHCSVVDEYHHHDNADQYDTFSTGMGARSQPLLLTVSTAGWNLAGPCKMLRDDCVKMLAGRRKLDTQFAMIYERDEGDKWDHRRTLKKVNPNFGVSIRPQYLYDQLEIAKHNAVKQSAFRTKHLNEWVGARELWLNLLHWQRQARRSLKVSDFADAPCYMGLDLASKRDLTALCLLFVRLIDGSDGDKKYAYTAFFRYWAPEAALKVNERYFEFAEAGDLVVTPGNMTDFRMVRETIIELCGTFDVRAVAYDKAQANQLALDLQDSGVPVVQFNQNRFAFSDPMKECEALVEDRRLWHDGNSATTWQVGNTAVKKDRLDSQMPEKENPNDPCCKIDGVVALIQAMGVALNDPQGNIDAFLNDPVMI